MKRTTEQIARAILGAVGDDGRWWYAAEIAAMIGESEQRVNRLLHRITRYADFDTIAESRQVLDGKSQFKVGSLDGKWIDIVVLWAQVEPIMQELEDEGRRGRPSTPPSVTSAIGRIQSMLVRAALNSIGAGQMMKRGSFRMQWQHLIERPAATHGYARGALDQQAAKLFFASGWTQQQIADVVGKSRAWVSRRHLFGRFLDFVPLGIPSSLTERKFRDYWKRTNKHHNEDARFREVLQLMEKDCLVEDLQHGEYEQSSDESPVNGNKVSLRQVLDEIQPILKELEAESKTLVSQYSPPIIVRCAGQIRAKLKTLSEQRLRHSGPGNPGCRSATADQ